MSRLGTAARARKQTYTAEVHRASDGFGWCWSVRGATGLGRCGWVAGKKRDAQAEARLAISELEGSK